MDLNLSKFERDALQHDLSLGEPYKEDDPILHILDGKEESDAKRWRATMAKRLLEQDTQEKIASGRPLEPESTPESRRRKAAADIAKP